MASLTHPHAPLNHAHAPQAHAFHPHPHAPACVASSYYLNQCWNIVNRALRSIIQWQLNRNTKIFIHKIAFENVVCEMAAIFSRGRWVNPYWRGYWADAYTTQQLTRHKRTRQSGPYSHLHIHVDSYDKCLIYHTRSHDLISVVVFANFNILHFAPLAQGHSLDLHSRCSRKFHQIYDGAFSNPYRPVDHLFDSLCVSFLWHSLSGIIRREWVNPLSLLILTECYLVILICMSMDSVPLYSRRLCNTGLLFTHKIRLTQPRQDTNWLYKLYVVCIRRIPRIPAILVEI